MKKAYFSSTAQIDCVEKGRSVDVDQLEMLVEGEFHAVGQFHLILLLAHLQFLDRLSGIVETQIASDGVGDQLRRHRTALAVDLRQVAPFVKLEFGAIAQHDVIALAVSRLHLGQHTFWRLKWRVITACALAGSMATEMGLSLPTWAEIAEVTMQQRAIIKNLIVLFITSNLLFYYTYIRIVPKHDTLVWTTKGRNGLRLRPS